VALVTGGGRGIGHAITLALARQGLAVAVAARTGAQVEAVADEVRALGQDAAAVTVDVADGASVAGAVAAVERGLGPVDILVNNAGIAEAAPFGRTDPELWSRHLRINVDGPYHLTRATLPGMLERRRGRVINVASLAGLAGAPYIAAYATSKHALVGFTRALAAEVAGTGVTVNAVCPGYVATDLVWTAARRIAEKTGRSFDEAAQALAAMNPGGRLVEPGEVAAAVVALVRDGSRNGETVVLDGARGVDLRAGDRGDTGSP
jgi:NAD(P)-dependent dehydrogenase (short-subunit alcohol dehydrogenase family)